MEDINKMEMDEYDFKLLLCIPDVLKKNIPNLGGL